MDNNSSIFMSQNETNDNDIAGKITYTNIINTIPEEKLDKPIIDWKKKYKTEWSAVGEMMEKARTPILSKLPFDV